MLINANLGPDKPSIPVAFVAVGGGFTASASITILAMLVGSIGWSKTAGDRVAKGEELGWFQVS